MFHKSCNTSVEISSEANDVVVGTLWKVNGERERANRKRVSEVAICDNRDRNCQKNICVQFFEASKKNCDQVKLRKKFITRIFHFVRRRQAIFPPKTPPQPSPRRVIWKNVFQVNSRHHFVKSTKFLWVRRSATHLSPTWSTPQISEIHLNKKKK